MSARPERIGIGLPATIPGGAPLVAPWAARAEERGFDILGVIDRLTYDNVEPLIALATAAGVTSRIDLSTMVLLAPLRTNVALLAKQLLSIHAVSGGRMVAGLGVGIRTDDYELSGARHDRRGADFDRLLEELSGLLRSAVGQRPDAFGPTVPTPVRLVLGGNVPATFRRLAAYGDGWMSGRAGLPMFKEGAPRARRAWEEAGRPGTPRLGALAYFCLGDDARARADAYLADYYGFSAEAVASAQRSVAVTPEDVRRLAADFAEAGCEELTFIPCAADLGQVDLLADAVGLR